MTDILRASNIAFAYGLQPVLRDVHLTLPAGQVVALLGPNGSGKSTLIKVLLGHLRSAGAILWNDKPLSAWKRRELARVVAYLPQSPAWEPRQTVAEVLRLGRSPYWGAFGIESSQDMAIVRDIAHLLELDDLLSRELDSLSGGQRQRVFLGRALVQQPRAMLLDEPNTFLDLRHQVELCQLLRKLAAEKSMAILMACHDLNLAGAFGDRLVLLHQGQVAACGDAATVLEPSLLSAVYGIAMERIERGKEHPPIVVPRVSFPLGQSKHTVDNR